jgi:anion-transporting  ArsA/GET3 family ATPase
VAVVTIDPARRLASALGIAHLGDMPHRVDPARVTAAGVPMAGTLDALQLDPRATFDRLVAREAPDEAARERILGNRIYRHLSGAVAGAQEFMAVERLHELVESGDYDVVVLDTPPARNALDFLDAPMRLGAFLDGRLMRILVAPARVGGRAYMRLVSASLGVFSNVLNKIIGAQVLADLQTFVASFEALFGGFRERAEQTYTLLAARGTAFLVIAAPEPDALREASYFVERLESEAMPLAGLVLNRVAPVRLPELSADQAAAGAERLRAQDPAVESTTALTASLLELHADRMRQSERQHRLADRFVAANPRVPVTAVTALAQDVHDLEGLRQVGDLMAQRRAHA